MALNKTIFIGRMVKDADVKILGDSKCANFTIAVDRGFKSKNPDAPTADFIPITAWRSTAEFVERYFPKGKQIYVCGSLETYSYDNKDGQKVYAFKINADEVGFADSAKSDNGGNGNTQNTGNTFPDMNNTSGGFSQFPPMGDFENDDLPF